jgi:hypothetical protein
MTKPFYISAEGKQVNVNYPRDSFPQAMIEDVALFGHNDQGQLRLDAAGRKEFSDAWNVGKPLTAIDLKMRLRAEFSAGNLKPAWDIAKSNNPGVNDFHGNYMGADENSPNMPDCLTARPTRLCEKHTMRVIRTVQ